MLLQPTLEGALLRLRPLFEDDFEELFKVASDPLIWEQHPFPDRYKKDIFQNFFNHALESKGAFVIEDQVSKKTIGSSRYYELKEDSVKIGFTFLARAYWGGIYNSELKSIMMDHAFKYVSTIYFDVGAKNLRSQKALLKIGAVKVGEEIRTRPDGGSIPSLIFAIKRRP